MPPSQSIKSGTPCFRRAAPRGGGGPPHVASASASQRQGGAGNGSLGCRCPMAAPADGSAGSYALVPQFQALRIVRLRGSLGGPFFILSQLPAARPSGRPRCLHSAPLGSEYFPSGETPTPPDTRPTNKRKKRCLLRRQLAYLFPYLPPSPNIHHRPPSPRRQAQAELSGARPPFRCSY